MESEREREFPIPPLNRPLSDEVGVVTVLLDEVDELSFVAARWKYDTGAQRPGFDRDETDLATVDGKRIDQRTDRCRNELEVALVAL